MSWNRLPLFIWSLLVYAILLIIALPVIAAAVTMLLDRPPLRHPLLRPDRARLAGPVAAPVRFFGTQVYIMILPGFGVISEVIPVFSRKPIFGYKAIAAATAVIAFLATLVWAHHMFASPIPIMVLGFFMLSSFLIGVPTGVKIFNWIATLWRGSLVMTTSLYFAIGFIAIFLIGGITGIFLAVFPVDWQLNDTYFVVAHFHYVLMGGAVFTVFAGSTTGSEDDRRMLNERARQDLVLVHVHRLQRDLLRPARTRAVGDAAADLHLSAGPGWSTYNMISTIGSYILGIGMLLTIINIYRSLRTARSPGPTRGRATRSSGSPPHRRRSTTSTSPAVRRSSRCATSAARSSARPA